MPRLGLYRDSCSQVRGGCVKTVEVLDSSATASVQEAGQSVTLLSASHIHCHCDEACRDPLHLHAHCI